MKKKIRTGRICTIIFASIISFCSSAVGSTTIDHFDEGTLNLSMFQELGTITQLESSLDIASVLGGQRFSSLTSRGDFVDSFTSFRLNSGNLMMNNLNAFATASVTYGNTFNLDAEFSSGDFIVEVESAETFFYEAVAFNMNLTLISGKGTDSEVSKTSSYIENTTKTNVSLQTITFNSSDFIGIDYSDIDTVTLSISAPENLNISEFKFSGDLISSVPEPSYYSVIMSAFILLYVLNRRNPRYPQSSI